jgi:hypothetical protein
LSGGQDSIAVRNIFVSDLSRFRFDPIESSRPIFLLLHPQLSLCRDSRPRLSSRAKLDSFFAALTTHAGTTQFAAP